MRVANLALVLTRFTARFVPSAFSIACFLTFITVCLGITAGEATLIETIRAWGDGFWILLKFGMQMCLIVFAGYVVAVARPVRAGLDRLARIPRSPTGAVVAMALASMLIAWLHWGLGLIASAVMVGYMAKHQPKADYRLLVAASYFGMGATWHAGPSGSVPLLLATADNFLIRSNVLGEVIGVDQTLLMPFNVGFTLATVVVMATLAALLHPDEGDRLTVDAAAVTTLVSYQEPRRPEAPTVAERIEFSPLVNMLIGAMATIWLVDHFLKTGILGGLNLDVVNFLFVTAAIVLHRQPASLGKAAAEGSQHLHGIVLQFPLYAGMFGVIKNTKLAEKISGAFVSVASQRSFPLITFWYSAVLNYFVPSGGSKWAIEAPYLIDAGGKLGVSVPRVAMAYAYGDMSTNLIQPFWAIPLLSVAKLEFKDILGFEAVAFLVYAIGASAALLWIF